jgi:ADP-ribosylglycohydrolase
MKQRRTLTILSMTVDVIPAALYCFLTMHDFHKAKPLAAKSKMRDEN